MNLSKDADKIATLLVLIGPTAVGKTRVSIELAKTFNADIFSSDSRQVYREMKIGTAAPTQEELATAAHHFIACKSVRSYYSASAFETDCLQALDSYFKEKSIAILCGGSMMYTDAVCYGIDKMPDVDPQIRCNVWQRYHEEGLTFAVEQLQKLDPDYLKKVDLNNHKRLLHALEVCLSTGRAFTSFHTGQAASRPFRLLNIGLQRPREELYERINQRVDEMLAMGLLEEVRSLLPYRSCNALNTVGYKELFEHLDGHISLEEASRKIKKNTRVYARKQMSWYRRRPDIPYFHPDRIDEIIQYIKTKL